MASTDLVFEGAPLLKGDLVFGDDGGSDISDAVISGTITLAGAVLSGQVVAAVTASGSIALAGATLSGEVIYNTDTQRPLVATAVVRWQDALPQPETVAQHWADANAKPAGIVARYQDALPLPTGLDVRFNDAARDRRQALYVRYQDGKRRHTGAEDAFQNATRLPVIARQRFQDGQPVRSSAAIRFQDATRGIAGQHSMRYQDALPLPVGVRSIVGSGLRVTRGWASRYQDAKAPNPGVSQIGPPVEPPEEPCYVPSPDLVFAAPWSADTNLVFYCERHDGPGPDPDPDTIIVPIRRIYTVINSASLRRVDDDTLIPTMGMSLTIDVDSWTWGFSARTPGYALPLLEPVGGAPVDVVATINGVAYRAIIEGISRDRTFGRSDLVVTGRGRAAVLDAPYSPVMTFRNENERSVQQLANDVLTFNGVSLGWDVDAGWKPEDWLVPAGVFSHQGTYIAALNAIAASAGAYLQPHPTAKAFNVLKRYPAKPWEWNDVVPDFELPADVVQREGITWVDKAIYNRVYVRSSGSSGIWQVNRAGTAGDIEAPMITDQLVTSGVGARQRALPVLADVGRQAIVSLRMPVLEETGIIPPGKFVRYVDGGTTRIGLVRTTAADVERSRESGLQIWQTIGVETHV